MVIKFSELKLTPWFTRKNEEKDIILRGKGVTVLPAVCLVCESKFVPLLNPFLNRDCPCNLFGSENERQKVVMW